MLAWLFYSGARLARGVVVAPHPSLTRTNHPGEGFAHLLLWTSLLLTGTINYVVPISLYIKALRSLPEPSPVHLLRMVASTAPTQPPSRAVVVPAAPSPPSAGAVRLGDARTGVSGFGAAQGRPRFGQRGKPEDGEGIPGGVGRSAWAFSTADAVADQDSPHAAFDSPDVAVAAINGGGGGGESGSDDDEDEEARLLATRPETPNTASAGVASELWRSYFQGPHRRGDFVGALDPAVLEWSHDLASRRGPLALHRAFLPVGAVPQLCPPPPQSVSGGCKRRMRACCLGAVAACCNPLSLAYGLVALYGALLAVQLSLVVYFLLIQRRNIMY